MGIRSALLSLERRFAWGVTGFVTGTLLGVAGLYYALHERKPSVAFEISGQFNVLDIRQPLPDLAISFQGQDIQKTNLNLRVLQLRVVNHGEADVLQGHFDQADIWGVAVQHARFLEIRLVEASSPYLRSTVQPRLVSDSVIQFSKVILERGQHFTVEALLLHSKTIEPVLHPIGKIVGLNEIPIVTRSSDATAPSAWKQATTGPLSVQLIRMLAYAVAAFLAIAIIGSLIAIIAAFFSNRARRKRERAIKLVLETTSPEEVLAKDLLVLLYSKGGLPALRGAGKAIADADALNVGLLYADDEFVPRGVASRHPRAAAEDAEVVPAPWLDYTTPGSPLFAHEVARQLGRKRLLVERAGKPELHPAFKKLLQTALRYFDESPQLAKRTARE